MSDILSKTELMQRVISGVSVEVFQHSTFGLFNVTAMRKAARNGRYGRPVSVRMLPEYVNNLKETRDFANCRGCGSF